MTTHPLALGESLALGDHIRLHLNSHWDGRWHLFVEAAWDQELDVEGAFHASAPCGFGWNAHVLVLGDGDVATIGPVRLWLEDARRLAAPAQALRDAVIHVDAPAGLFIKRKPGMTALIARLRGRRAGCGH